MNTSEFWRNLRRRKTKFIDRKQQTRFAIEILVIMLLFPLLFFVLVIIPPFSTIFLGKNADVLSALFINQLYMIKSVWWVVAFVLVYVAMLSIFMSHKIFGPIYRLSQAIRQKLDGQENIHCRLRKGDYFIDFSDLLRELIETDQPKKDDADKTSENPQA
jgi:uncharacterized membrane protein (DUF485 family)